MTTMQHHMTASNRSCDHLQSHDFNEKSCDFNGRSCDFKERSCDTQSYIENVKNDAPMVGLTLREKVFPTCRNTSDVLPTPER